MEHNSITDECIIYEYLNNWFTYQELSGYLCIPLARVENVLTNSSELDNNTKEKIKRHTDLIQKYYEHLNKKEIYEEDNLYVLIAKYIIKTKSSIRKTAEKFKLGKTTIHEYIHEKLPKVSIILYKQVFDVLMDNKSYSTNNVKVVEQILTSYNYLENGYSIDKIKDLQGLSWSAVQRNLTVRLKKIDKEKYKCAKQILSINQLKAIQDTQFKSKTTGK